MGWSHRGSFKWSPSGRSEYRLRVVYKDGRVNEFTASSYRPTAQEIKRRYEQREDVERVEWRN